MATNGPNPERQLFASIIKNPDRTEQKRLIAEMPREQQVRFGQFYKQLQEAKALREKQAQIKQLEAEREELLREKAAFISSQSTQVASSLGQIKAPTETTGTDKKKTNGRRF